MTRMTITSIIALLFIIPSQLSAQYKRGTALIYVTGAADAQLNAHDVEQTESGIIMGGEAEQYGLLRCKSNVGGRLGIEFMGRSKQGVLLTTGFDFKIVPQKVSVLYNAANYGYPGSNYSYRKDFSFTNFSVDYKLSLGYSIPVASHKGAIEVTTGIVLDLPMNGKNNGDGELIYDQPRNSTNKELIMYAQEGWGNQKPYGNNSEGILVNIFCHLQVAYRFVPGTVFPNNNLRVGFDLFGIAGGDYLNKIEVTTYSDGRASSSKQTFKDQKTSVGLFAAISL